MFEALTRELGRVNSSSAVAWWQLFELADIDIQYENSIILVDFNKNLFNVIESEILFEFML